MSLLSGSHTTFACGKPRFSARRRSAARQSKLDSYKPIVDRLLKDGGWNAQVILREI